MISFLIRITVIQKNIWKIISLWIYFNIDSKTNFEKLWVFNKEEINKTKNILEKEKSLQRKYSRLDRRIGN